MESSDIMRRVLRDILWFYNYNVDCVDSADKAINLIENIYYDLVIVDYAVPWMNGIELTKQIRSKRPDLPVMGMSSNHKEDKIHFIKAGANVFLPKPLDFKALLEAVSSTIDTPIVPPDEPHT